MLSLSFILQGSSLWAWWKRRDRKATSSKEVLQGSPVRPRRKTYSAETGYVYQYVYRGWRRSPGGDAIEHVFHASREPTLTSLIQVRLMETAIAQCEQRLGRTLLNAERYAIAKMTLFRAFDETVDFARLSEAIVPNGEQMSECLAALGRLS
jgi:hypothetical protein